MRCLNTKTITNPVTSKKMVVRCGKCPLCRQFRAESWAIRLKEQIKCTKDNWFLTLTLSDENLTYGENSPTLNKRDLQLFFKRFRKKNPEIKFKYFAVGEYGEQTKRPHYHVIMFNTQLDNMKLIKYVSEDSWQKGYIHVGEVNEKSIRYVCGYLDKGEQPPEGIQRLFSLMSKGLGENYLNTHKDYHDKTKKFEYHTGNGRFFPLPRYYRDKIFSQSDKEKYAESIEETLEGKTRKEQLERYQALRNRVNSLQKLKPIRK